MPDTANQPMHTPGPWDLQSPADMRSPHQVNGRHGIIARVARGNIANARLIAAAPDLLAACRKCMEQYAAHGDFTQAEYEMILAAIAKAEGR